ncbi:LytR/AlgR family response regulator transcription factor [Spongiimicrobium salis]|uniref:LytR/AlgR family response regulator transcription factor n=1 Tax=Spongiimicrobium salis TaxID=1667022 RepID=UPI00374DD7B6
MSIKAIVIEDEQSARHHIMGLIAQYPKPIDIITSLATVTDSIAWLQHNTSPDLIFMDIHLSDGLAFDIMEEVELTCPIIYTTAYDQYAIKAFKTTGIDYLLKPISQEELHNALDKFKATLPQDPEAWFLKNMNLFQAINTHKEANYNERFLLKSGRSLHPVKTQDIAYFYRDELVFAQCFDGKSYPMDESLNQLQKVLNPTRFIRLNRQYLVNIEAIEKLVPYKPGQLQLLLHPISENPIYLSQERSSWLKQFLSPLGR